MIARLRARRATVLGLLAILLWSTTVALGRDVIERTGLLVGGALIFSGAGVISLAVVALREKGCGWLRHLSVQHLVVCGPLFVGYLCLLYLALGLARSRTDAVVAGLINYLWPSMILVFSVLILKERAYKLRLGMGLFLALAGVALATTGELEGPRAVLGAVVNSPTAMGCALAASLLWGLYSVLTRRLPQALPSGAVALFLLLTGGILALAAGDTWRQVVWHPMTLLRVLYMAVFPTSLAYSLWDVAMRSGDVPLLGAAANVTPILATLIGGLILRVPLGWTLLLGAVLVGTGSFVARFAFRRPGASPP